MPQIFNSLAVTVLMAICLVCTKINAAVITITEGSTSGYALTDGNTYVVQNSVEFSNSTVGGSGMSVADNATVVLYVPAGVTLTATGANGSGRTGGGAGIRVPETATLVITGEGTVNATGGNAGDGAKGVAGSSAKIEYYAGAVKSASVGSGGVGGAGGGGAGAGIGGNGGLGGLASGGSGGSGKSMGTVCVLGSICVMTQRGLGGAAGACGSSGRGGYYADYGKDNYVSGGGGGGGGGAGSPPAFSIGGGGAGGGAGGSGEKGTKVTNATYCDSGATGRGGGSETKNGAGGYGNSGGSAGTEGAVGILYVSPTATVNVEREKLTATTHSAIPQYTITFDSNDGEFLLSAISLTATLGCELPDCIPAPTRRGYKFDGWKTESGEEYYGLSGTKSKATYSVVGDIVLYAQWRSTVLPDSAFWIRDNAETGWFVDSETDEGTVFRSGEIGNSTNSWMETTITGPLSFSFDWKVSCNSRGHYLAWFIDGVEQARIRGETEWEKVHASVPEGEHIVRFVYEKGSTSVAGEDKGLVRNFELGMRVDTDSMQVTWDWTTNYWVECSVVGKGSTSFGAQWVVDGTNLTIPFLVNTPFYSLSLSGDAHGVVVGDGCLSLSVTSPRSIVLIVTEYTYSTALDSGWLLWNSGGAANWIAQGDESYDGSSAVRSGEVIGDDVSTISTIVTGPGTLRWWWKLDMTDCAGVDVFVDESFVSSLDYVSDWRAESIEITSEGRHTVRFEFWNAGNGAALSDHAYMDKVSWMPIKSEIDHTTTTLVPVPHSYFEMNYPTLLGMHGGDYESAALATAANGRKVWECFMLGLDPMKEDDDFKITHFWMENGKPMFEFSHSVDGAGNSFVPRIKVKGKANLTDSWSDVPDGGDPSFRFFTVEVALP